MKLAWAGSFYPLTQGARPWRQSSLALQHSDSVTGSSKRLEEIVGGPVRRDHLASHLAYGQPLLEIAAK